MKIKNVVSDVNKVLVRVKEPKSKWVKGTQEKSIGELGDIYRQRTSLFPHPEVRKSAETSKRIASDAGKKLDILA